MVGRVEIVTPRQRWLLRRIASAEAIDRRWLTNEVPEYYRAYLDLGRFRNALVLDEAQHRPSKAIETFLNAYGIRYTHPPGTDKMASGDVEGRRD